MIASVPHSLLSDERLARLAGAGSGPAFDELHRRYERILLSYCRSITHNPDDARDALQNAMMKALVALRRDERRAPLRPWLFRIAHNEAISVMRRRSHAEPLGDDRDFLVVAGADEQAVAREGVAEIVTDLRSLPTGQRAALVMRELAGLDYGELATALETTEVNARQLVFSARASLRDSREGRGLPCESVRDQLASADGRWLRRRTLRAHLRACDSCRGYADDVRARPRALRPVALLSPLGWWGVLENALRGAVVKGVATTAVVGASVGGVVIEDGGRAVKPESRKAGAAEKAEKAGKAGRAGERPAVAVTTAAVAPAVARVRTRPAVARTSSPRVIPVVERRRSVRSTPPRRDRAPRPPRDQLRPPPAREWEPRPQQHQQPPPQRDWGEPPPQPSRDGFRHDARQDAGAGRDCPPGGRDFGGGDRFTDQ